MKILHSTGKEGLVFLARNVLRDVGAAAFGVTHFTEDATIRAGDSFDRVEGAVRIVGDGHARFAGGIGVLGRDLAVSGQVLNLLRGGVELALSVGDGNEMEIVDGAVGEPR